MKKLTVRYFIICIFLVAAGSRAFAIGLSLNVKDTGRNMPTEGISLSTPMEYFVKKMNGIDLTLDTALSSDRIFSYRVNFEFDNIVSRRDGFFGDYSFTVNRLIWSNTFSFGLIRTDLMKIWVGPQITLSYEFKNRNNSISDPVVYNKFGSVLGANFNAAKDFVISVEMGFRAGYGFDLTRNGRPLTNGSRVEPIAGFKLIFRSWDAFLFAGV